MKSRLSWTLKAWPNNMVLVFNECLNIFVFWITGQSRLYNKIYHPVLLEALSGGKGSSDIFDHLNVIFYFSSFKKNSLFVELGTRGGESTRSLLAAAEVTDSALLSIDIDDCGTISVPFLYRWTFLQANDVEFGKNGFIEWCRNNNKEPAIDVLFIDTSHEYEHTKQELDVWLQYLANDGVAILHDTNMGTGVYAKMNGALGASWNNKRGVIRAVEDLLGKQYDERSFFCDIAGEYSIIHFPYSNGLTVLKKREC